jgi:hypothetical protein
MRNVDLPPVPVIAMSLVGMTLGLAGTLVGPAFNLIAARILMAGLAAAVAVAFGHSTAELARSALELCGIARDGR